MFLGRLAEFELKLSELPEMQANFVLAVLADPTNFTAAARVAGYKNPNVEGTRLRTYPRVADLIALGEQLREDRTRLTSDRTLHELAIVAFSDITDYEFDLARQTVKARSGVPEYATRAISSMEVEEHEYEDDEGRTHVKRRAKVRLWSKTDALKMIAIYQKLMSDTPNVNVDQSQHVHLHQHQHNTWQFGDQKLTF